MHRDPTSEPLTRRDALLRFGALGLGAAALGGGAEGLVARAAAAAPRHHGSMRDIEHVIFLMQENRSFDHYFGTLRGVRGFGDRRDAGAFRQKDPRGETVLPFRLGRRYCMPDITHDWAPQHQAWNHGRMNRFVRVHEQVDKPAGTGAETMGYYTRADLPFYYALADHFTICDGYHCSVIGPTDPNRIMSMSATLDPAGAKGGPLLQTLVAQRNSLRGAFRWTTMPERLQRHGISWKVYMDQTGGGIFDNVLTYFAAFNRPGELARRGLGTSFPGDFVSDLQQDRLPKVSWLLPGLTSTEHPGFSSAVSGEQTVALILAALLSRPHIWRKTALFITWDENGGFFDHVAPPVAPRGTKGEYVTVSPLPRAAHGIAGPIGLGFRVPMLVVSPYSRGGLVCSDTFDHTSMLRFLEARFGVEVPNLSAWRRRVTGDLTSAFDFAAAPDARRPRLPVPSGPSAIPPGDACTTTPVAVRSPGIPHQEPGRPRRPSGIVHGHAR